MARDAIKDAARAAVANAILRGDLVRPTHCTACGVADSKMSDGRTAIQGHHHKGYNYPLDVKWLCHRCHYEDEGRAKLTAEKVADIRALYQPNATRFTPNSAGKLAKRFGVTLRTIKQIVHGDVWGTEGAVPVARKAGPPAERTHCPQGHEYIAENIRLDPKGHRFCRTCDRARGKRWYYQEKAKRNHILNGEPEA